MANRRSVCLCYKSAFPKNVLSVRFTFEHMTLKMSSVLCKKEHFGRHFLTYLQNVWTYFNETCSSIITENYSGKKSFTFQQVSDQNVIFRM